MVKEHRSDSQDRGPLETGMLRCPTENSYDCSLLTIYEHNLLTNRISACTIYRTFDNRTFGLPPVAGVS